MRLEAIQFDRRLEATAELEIKLTTLFPKLYPAFMELYPSPPLPLEPRPFVFAFLLASAIGRFAYLQELSSRYYGNIYLCIDARSGGWKNVIIGLAYQLCNKFTNVSKTGGSYLGLMEKIAKRGGIVSMFDTEFGKFLISQRQDYRLEMTQVLADLADSSSGAHEESFRTKTSINIPETRCINWCVGIQPHKLEYGMTSQSVFGGFWPRWVFVYVVGDTEYIAYAGKTSPSYEKDFIDEIFKLKKRAQDSRKPPKDEILLEGEPLKRLEAFTNWLNKSWAAKEGDDIFLVRLISFVKKMAINLSVGVDPKARVFSADAMEIAIHFGLLALCYLQKLDPIGLAAIDSEFERKVEKAGKILVSVKEIQRGELSNKLKINAVQSKLLKETLIERRYIEPPEPRLTGGRTAEWYKVIPEEKRFRMEDVKPERVEEQIAMTEGFQDIKPKKPQTLDEDYKARIRYLRELTTWDEAKIAEKDLSRRVCENAFPSDEAVLLLLEVRKLITQEVNKEDKVGIKKALTLLMTIEKINETWKPEGREPDNWEFAVKDEYEMAQPNY